MKSPSATDQHATEREALVGKAILRFGDIELVSIKCLSLIPSDKITDTASRLDFSRRAELLVEVLEARTEKSPEMSVLLNGFKRAKELAQLRNLIAHNPVMLELYVNEDETQSFARHSISSARTGKQSLDLDGLKEFAEEVEQLSSELWMALLKVAETSEHLWRTYPSKS
jgi:hypothetical protein